MVEYTFSRFAYFDTGILSFLARNNQLWPKLREFLFGNDLTLGICGAQLSELSDATRLHQALVELFMSVPSALLKDWEVIRDEEVEAHPNHRKATLLKYPLNSLLLKPNGTEELLTFLGSSDLRDARNDQKRHAKQLEGRLNTLKSNFPPSKSGKYVQEQVDEFANGIVIQVLRDTQYEFLNKYRNNAKDLHLDVFLSVRLFAQVVYYKYYLGERDPDRPSDFGDLAHLALIPYCELAVMERDLSNVLCQIKNHGSSLSSTVIRNIDFFEDWIWK
ncbi:MAG: hypothetical protein WEC16_00230 [Anaerolineales bacterium]